MLLYIILSALIGGGLVYIRLRHKLQEKYQLDEKIQQEEKELLQNVQNLKCELISLTTEKELTVDQIQELSETLRKAEKAAQESADSFLQSKIEAAKNKLILEQQKLDKELEEYKRQLNREDINRQMIELTSQLDSIRSKYQAAIEDQRRQLEKETKLDFYRILLPEEDKSEIQALLSIEYLLSNKRNLRMLIWSSYYSKAVNDLASRVLGSKTTIGIYKITNIQTNQVYIGQSKDIRTRWRDHIKAGGCGVDCPATNKFYQNMRKYGIENFTFELQEECSESELNDREKYWISFYEANTFGLNGTSGGS